MDNGEFITVYNERPLKKLSIASLVVRQRHVIGNNFIERRITC